jgi:hypothetical protein
MDQLQQLVVTLRVLARTNEPNRVASVEKAIDEYLNDKAGTVRLSLDRLCNAIEREEADRRALEDWSQCDYMMGAGWPDTDDRLARSKLSSPVLSLRPLSEAPPSLCPALQDADTAPRKSLAQLDRIAFLQIDVFDPRQTRRDCGRLSFC